MDFAPNCEGTLDGTIVRTNSIGLRDREVGDDGSIRVLTIGDSCTWGWGVPADAAYPQVLQNLLNSPGRSTTYRVINAGRPGYTSYQGLVYLRESGLTLHPAIVIFAYGFNDAFHRGDVERDIEWQSPRLPLIEANDFLLRYSKLLRWLNTKAMAAALQSDRPPAGVEKYKRNLAEIVKSIRENGAKPLMISFWDPGSGDVGEGGQNPGSKYRIGATEVAAEMNVPTVVYAGPRLDIVHPTKEGYDRLATEVKKELEKLGYLSGPGPAGSAELRWPRMP